MSASEQPRGASPLEVLHPAGAVERVLISGEGWPPQLLPLPAEHAATDVGIALLAPSARQLTRRGWLAHALSDAANALAGDGVLYALLPPLARTAARRRLRGMGLELPAPLVQLPARAPRYLLPVHEPPWRHMLSQEIAAHPRVRQALRGAESLPGGAVLLRSALPGTALLARRPGAAPLADWLHRLDGETQPTAQVALQTSWRGPGGPLVLFCFARGERRPWGVAKVGVDSAREARQLEELGPDAAEAGAIVPRLLARGVAGEHPVLVESALGGDTAAPELMEARGRFADLAGRIAAWLERWGAGTTRAERLAADCLEPLLARLDLPPTYRRWLGEQAAALAGTVMPMVAAHHDLTMWNVRLGEDGALGILDWAESEREALPLGDLFYAVADAAAACEGYRDRAAAARSCFEPGAERSTTVAPLVERMRVALGLSPAAVELCLHACWLRHAGNERAAGAAERPFAEIVRWLAHRAGAS